MISRIVLALCVVLAATPAARAASGITPLAPATGATVAVGERPTFKLRVKGSGQVWVGVCASKRKDSKGVICNRGNAEDMGRAKRGAGGVYTYKGKFFDFPGYWLNRPGTYYWQAYRIACEGGRSDCLQESRIIEFEVG